MIHIENCLDTMSRMPDNHIDLTVTSPPYDDLRKYNGYSFEFEKIAKELFRVTKKGGVVIWVVGDATKNGSESGTSFRQALFFKEVGFRLHDTMIYAKNNFPPLTHNRYEQQFEYMFALSKGKPKTFNPIKVPCKQAGKVERYGTKRRSNFGNNHAMRLYKEETFIATAEEKIAPNIFYYSTGSVRSGHPAAFPDKLAEDQILSWSNEGDLVYDPFTGSGTTGKMAILNNREFEGSEISAEYAEIANRRINEAWEKLLC